MTNLYDVTVPVVAAKLRNLKHIVQLGVKHAADSDIDEAAFTSFRLFPDMLPFSSQINIATDIVAGCTSRLTGNERLSLDDSKTDFASLIARIDQTVDHLGGQKREDYEGTADKAVSLKTPLGDISFNGTDYVTHFVFPNVYFHITTAYNILRHNGVRLSKVDYIRGG